MPDEFTHIPLPETQTPEALDRFIAACREERARLVEGLDAIAAERRGLAVAAAGGDPPALARLKELNVLDTRGRDRIDVLDTAAGQAADMRAAAEKTAADGAAAERLALQCKAAAKVAVKAAGFDAAARRLGKAAGEYLEAIEDLRRSGAASAAYNKLRNRTMVAGALHLAGVASIVPLPPVSPSHRRTLENWAVAMVAAFLPPPAVGSEAAPAVPTPSPVAAAPPIGMPAPAAPVPAGPALEPDEMLDERGRVVLRPEAQARSDALSGRA